MTAEEIDAQLVKAIQAHGAWKRRLYDAIDGGANELDVAKVRCDDCCDFGQWLYGDQMPERLKAGKPYEVVRRLHAEFHTCAADVLDKIKSGQTFAAKTLMESSYTERTNKLSSAMTKWRGEIAMGKF